SSRSVCGYSRSSTRSTRLPPPMKKSRPSRRPVALLAVDLRSRGPRSLRRLERQDDGRRHGEWVFITVLPGTDARRRTRGVVGGEDRRRQRGNQGLGRELEIELGDGRQALAQDGVATARHEVELLREHAAFLQHATDRFA